ncbi:hypothetical protein V8B97DRAFT_2003637 [Scleroderma yunnanense]
MLQYPAQQPQPVQQQQPSDSLKSKTLPAMRLRDDPVQPTPTPTSQPSAPTPPTATTTTTTTTTRNTRKRKSPPTAATAPPQPQLPQQHPPPPPGMHLGQMLPPPHALVPPGMPHPPPHIYQYAPPEYTQPPPPPPQSGDQQQSMNGPNDQSDPHSPKGGPGRQLSQSKRAEQNRKAQRAFRERRDQHVKALESRSQLLDAALASADEANRRWEECRALVDQLRIENAALRAALSQAQSQLGQLGQGLPASAQQSQSQQQQPQDSKEGEKTETPTTKSDG